MEEATAKEVPVDGPQTMANSMIDTNVSNLAQKARESAPTPKLTYTNVFSSKSLFGNDVEYVDLCGEDDDDEGEPSLERHVNVPYAIRSPDLPDLPRPGAMRKAKERKEATGADQLTEPIQRLATMDEAASRSKNTVSPKSRTAPSKHMVRDSDTELRSHEIRAQQNDRSKILTAASLLPRHRTLLGLTTLRKKGGFVSNVLGAERSSHLASEIQDIFPSVSKTSGELAWKATPQKRKADDGGQEIPPSTGFRPGKMTHAVKAARIGFTEPPKTVALVTPPPTPLKSSYIGTPSTLRTPTSGTTTVPSESRREIPGPLAFSLKPPIWTPWHGSEYQDLATAIATSLLIDKFAIEHNRTRADVLSVLDATVLRPLRDVEEAKERTEKGLAQLFALYADYGTPTRIWAKGSGYEIIGELKDVRLGEVIVDGKSLVAIDQDDDGAEASAPERVVIPITVLTRSDHQWLYGVLKEDKRKLLGRLPRKPRPKALQVDTSTSLTSRESELMTIAKSGAVNRSLTPSPTSSSRSNAMFPDTMSSPSPTMRYSRKT